MLDRLKLAAVVNDARYPAGVSRTPFARLKAGPRAYCLRIADGVIAALAGQGQS